VRVRDYSGPLGVLAAGALGFSLFCVVSAMALAGPQRPNSAAMEPESLLDMAVSNLNTAAALTVAAVPEYLTTPTIAPTNTAAPTSTVTVTVTASTTPLPTLTLFHPLFSPTRTRRPGSSSAPTKPPTPIPTRTYTQIPTATNTPVPPPTNTIPPPPTGTSTPVPQPTETQAPPPTNTQEPDPTNTPGSVQIEATSDPEPE